MSKVKIPKSPVVEDLGFVIRSTSRASIELYKEDDLYELMDPWLALEWYNLITEGMEPDEDMLYPQASIRASLRSYNSVSAFYVVVIGTDNQFLYSLESLSAAVDLIRELKEKYQNALQQQEA